MKRTTIGRALAVIVALALAAGCSGGSSDGGEGADGYNAALKSVVSPSQKTGGTLKVGTAQACENFDPATTYGGTCWFMHRVLSRSLVAFGKTGEGTKAGAGAEVEADLATSLGKTNADKTKWTYTLRDGVKFANGDSITSGDVKYAFERMYATDVITGGPEGYYLCLLDTCDGEGTPTYQGPYKDPKGDLSSISTPDDKTITFTLNKPFGDWDYLMALPTATPVPKKADKGAQYGAGTNLVSSGPYMLKSVKTKQKVVLVRNPEWSRASDPIRSALPDQMDFTILSNADDLDSRLKTGALDYSIDGSVQTTFQSEILNSPKLKADADNPVLAIMNMLVLYPTDEALSDIHCRLAVAYAIDKRDLLVQGGGTQGASYASTLMPPPLPGYDSKANPYPSGKDWTGDLTKAKSELAECGKPEGFTTTIGYSNYGSDPQAFASAQASLKRVGIEVKGKQLDSSTSFTTLTTPATVKSQGIGIGLLGWAPDYPSGNGFLTLLVDPSRYFKANSSTNMVDVDEPAINALIDKAATASTGEQPEIYRQMDVEAMKTAYYIPLNYQKSTLYRTSGLTNLDLRGITNYDLGNIGISSDK